MKAIILYETSDGAKHTTEENARKYWKTSNNQNLNEGEKYEVIGKVKEHKLYGVIPQTFLTRCKVKSLVAT